MNDDEIKKLNECELLENVTDEQLFTKRQHLYSPENKPDIG